VDPLWAALRQPLASGAPDSGAPPVPYCHLLLPESRKVLIENAATLILFGSEVGLIVATNMFLYACSS